MDKRLFDDAIGEVPPSTVDVDAVITRGRRAARVRWAANPAVAAGVAVVALTGAVAFTMGRGDDGGAVGGVGNQPTTSLETTSSPEGSPTAKSRKPAVEAACSRPDLESPAEITSRLSTVAKAAVQAQRPDLPLVANPASAHADGVLDGPLDFYRWTSPDLGDVPICHEESAFIAMAAVNEPAGETGIQLIITPDLYDSTDFYDCSNPSEGETCTTVAGPNGAVVAKKTLPQLEGRVQSRVNIVRQDGTRVSIIVENLTTPNPLPLNHDQMIAIGTDPGMTLFP